MSRPRYMRIDAGSREIAARSCALVSDVPAGSVDGGAGSADGVKVRICADWG